ncbi:MAG: aldolase/citrate lyase family protein [Terrimicrobiaceae bacterium]
MSSTKQKLKSGEVVLGAWNMIPHPNVAELMAGEGFDWICVDMEHTSQDFHTLENIARAVKAAGKDLLVRLPACDDVAAKKALDCGADGIIVPCVCTKEEAEKAVAIAKYPPKGIRGASLARCTDYGRNFHNYFKDANDKVLVIIMLEHIKAVENVEEILSVPGIDATFIGPYDLSSSMNLAGQLDNPDVLAAQKILLDACIKHSVPPGFHIVPNDPPQVARRIEMGYRFIALGLDTGFIIEGCRAMLAGVAGTAHK